MIIEPTLSAWEADDWVACPPATVSRAWDGEPSPMQLALARGQRWLAMLESREVKSLREIARKEGVDSRYVSRMVNLTTLAPDIVEAILDETLSADATLFDLTVDPLALWEEPAGARRLDKLAPIARIEDNSLGHTRIIVVCP